MGCNSSKNADTSNQNKPEDKTENQEQDEQNEQGEGADLERERKRQRMLSVANEMGQSEIEEMKRDLLSNVVENDDDRSNQQVEYKESDSGFDTQGGHGETESKEQEEVKEDTGSKKKEELTVPGSEGEQQDDHDCKPETGPNVDASLPKEESQTESIEELTGEKRKGTTLESESKIGEKSDKTAMYIEDCYKQGGGENGVAADDIKGQKPATETQQQATEGNEGGE